MKKLRKVSMKELDILSSAEKSKLYGGGGKVTGSVTGSITVSPGGVTGSVSATLNF